MVNRIRNCRRSARDADLTDSARSIRGERRRQALASMDELQDPYFALGPHIVHGTADKCLQRLLYLVFVHFSVSSLEELGHRFSKRPRGNA